MGFLTKYYSFDEDLVDLEDLEDYEYRADKDETLSCISYNRYEKRHCPEITLKSIALPDEQCPEHFVAIDFETATTSGFACQLGIVEVIDGQIVFEKEYNFQPPENKYDWACSSTHGMAELSTKDEKTFDYYWPEIREILQGKTIVAHNVSFDIRVLAVNMNHYGLGEIEVNDIICTSSELGRADLFSACKYFGVEIGAHHTALCDARAAALLLLAYSKKPGVVVTIPKVKEKRSRKVSKQNRTPSESADTSSPAYGKRFVISGVFDRWPERDDLAALLSGMGAFVLSSVSGKTDFLVTGHAAGPSKIVKAMSLQEAGSKIEIITEAELVERFGL